MSAQLAKVGLEESIWLQNPNRPDVPSDIVRAFKISGAPMTEGEFSATLKHFMALHLFLQSGSELGLVMEDRIEFLGDFAERLQRYRAALPGSFDILFEGDMMRIPGYGGAYSREPNRDFVLLKMRRGIQDWAHGATNGANCYLITRRAAKRVVANFLPFGKVIDHHLNEIIRVERLNVYWPMPPAVHRRDIPSTVQFDGDGSPASQIT
jgi:GR25 family glycosyltransferase involved in LPS biosynthesis